MVVRIHGLSFEPPAAFGPAEASVTLRGPVPPKATLSLGPQLRVQPHLEVRRARMTEITDLATVALRVVSEVAEEVPDLETPKQEAFEFADGAKGFLFRFDYPLEGGACLHQYQAVRLDDDTVTNVVLTIDKRTLSPDLDEEYRGCIKSLRVTNALELEASEGKSS